MRGLSLTLRLLLAPRDGKIPVERLYWLPSLDNSISSCPHMAMGITILLFLCFCESVTDTTNICIYVSVTSHYTVLVLVGMFVYVI